MSFDIPTKSYIFIMRILSIIVFVAFFIGVFLGKADVISVLLMALVLGLIADVNEVKLKLEKNLGRRGRSR